ncbi:hypothetical protein FK513_30195, partial [Klebsiella pneumoniae]|nr:hypothetical protein [Klebsiella pneumoniae]
RIARDQVSPFFDDWRWIFVDVIVRWVAPLLKPFGLTGMSAFAVAVGRLGAMSGPLLAGKMLALGTGTGTVGVRSSWLMLARKRLLAFVA